MDSAATRPPRKSLTSSSAVVEAGVSQRGASAPLFFHPPPRLPFTSPALAPARERWYTTILTASFSIPTCVSFRDERGGSFCPEVRVSYLRRRRWGSDCQGPHRRNPYQSFEGKGKSSVITA